MKIRDSEFFTEIIVSAVVIGVYASGCAALLIALDRLHEKMQKKVR